MQITEEDNKRSMDRSTKESALTYFSAMITAMAFIPIFTDFILSRLPECAGGKCSDIEIVYLSSGHNYLMLFAFISFSILWLLSGKLRIYFLPEDRYLIDRVLPPKDDTLSAMVIMATSMTVFLIVSTVSAMFIFFPDFSIGLVVKIFENQISYMVGVFFIAISLIFARYKNYSIALFLLVFGLLYFITALFS